MHCVRAAAAAAAVAAADGSSSGLLLLSSNGMEVTLESVKMTYRYKADSSNQDKTFFVDACIFAAGVVMTYR
jgi:hypothetical protein